MPKIKQFLMNIQWCIPHNWLSGVDNIRVDAEIFYQKRKGPTKLNRRMRD